MTADQSAGANEGPTFQTVRPTSDPVAVALSADDPRSAFLDLMRDRLGPGRWAFPIDNGFAWVAYRLKHSIECFNNDDGVLVARSTFVLVENVTDVGQALNMVGYLNQRSFGGALWFDFGAGTICLTTVAHLDPRSWWNAYLFGSIVPRLVGICEHLAPRLADWVDAEVALAAHPEHGLRTDPDQFCGEHTMDTYVPEAGAGLWWSAREVLGFREVVDSLVSDGGGRIEWPVDPLPGTLLSDSMGTTARLPMGEGWLQATVGEADHPDLGLGLQVLLSLSVKFAGTAPDGVDEVQPRSMDAMFVANELNRLVAVCCPAPLTLAGWTLWDNQLHQATYVQPEVVRMLQSAAQPTVGEALGLLVRDLIVNVDPLRFLLGHEDNADVEWAHIEEVSWRGVGQNAGYKSLLVNEAECVPRAIEGLPVNTLLSEPVDLDDELWALQSNHLVMTMGIFNPVGPSVGSIELAIDYNLQRGLLVERLRHPFSPSIRLWAVLDRDGFASLDDFVELLIERLPWSTFEWVRILDSDPAVASSVERGLLRFIKRRDLDLATEAQRLIDGMVNPWIRLDRQYVPSGSLQEFDGDSADLWLEAVTHPAVVDSCLAHLRSAWEGAKAFVRDPNGPEASDWVARISDEVASRRAGPPWDSQ